MQKMILKYLFAIILCVNLFSSILTQRQGGPRRGGPREYVEEYPEDRRQSAVGSITFEETEPKQCSKLCLNEKYLKHYYAKGCKPVEGEIRYCSRPCYKYFDCPKKQTKPALKRKTECEYKGVNYPIGQLILVDNDCKVCQCVDSNLNGNFTKPSIICTHIECAEHLGGLRPPSSAKNPRNCFNVYEPNKCCAVRLECPSDEDLPKFKSCLQDGQYYKYGQRIYPIEDPCLSCVCNDKWNQTNPLKSEACKPVSCDFELEERLKNGCIPVYHEGTCCPVTYHCPPPKEHHCVFDGQLYRIGAKLEIGDACVDCKCRVPPDFTCIQKQCPPQPNGNCTANYPDSMNDNRCCPTYECQENNDLSGKKGSISFQTHQELVEDKITSKLNIDINTPSSTLAKPKDRAILRKKISPGVIVTSSAQQLSSEVTSPPTRPCPTNVEHISACNGGNCTIVNDVFNCKICSCSSCPELKCDGEGCYLWLVTPGACPKCNCPQEV